jgi:hypothetical protein
MVHGQAQFVEVQYGAERTKYIAEVLAIGTFTSFELHEVADCRSLRKVDVDVAVCRYFTFPLGLECRRHPVVPACEYVCRDNTYQALDPRAFLRPVALIREVKRGPNARSLPTPDTIASCVNQERFFCLDELL